MIRKSACNLQKQDKNLDNIINCPGERKKHICVLPDMFPHILLHFREKSINRKEKRFSRNEIDPGDLSFAKVT